MKLIRYAVLFAFTFLSSFISASEGESCLANAMTQSKMNQCAGVGYKEADAELNRVYKQIREIYKDDAKFLGKLKKAQLAWIQLRDADFELEYPHTEDPSYYGSSFSMCASGHKTWLTLQRVEFLKRWLVGAEEGDVCSGSQMYQWRLQEILKNKYNQSKQ
ncbi:lysozyme inhibitor LprI family protein [Shewanella sp. Isolate7]|uniref:lysozyme inhibitor LprI family protein n=1 Tax=Shewanella sp. Isolate7 TaxID=2908528 RepID=UPI001EFD4989|nr:lysozyme inhibitor LprI family protein [Shewanella sp. Isolate7]MCG9723609.1 DUF1311 domain-containing protein [Shewanella sp. Isolate7]